MDLAKITQFRNQLVADATAALERRGIEPDKLKQPVDLQAEQAARVRQRIEGLERRKAEVVASLDAELDSLRRDLKAREQRIKAGQSGQDKPPEAPAAGGASDTGKKAVAAAPAAREEGVVGRTPAKKPRAPSGKGT